MQNPEWGEGIKACGYLGNKYYQRGSSECKYPEVGVCLAYSRNSKKANEAGAERE